MTGIIPASEQPPSNRYQAQSSDKPPGSAASWRTIVALLAGGLGLALGLAWVSNGGRSLDGWTAFAAVLALCLGLGAATWWALGAENKPRRLAGVLLLAFALRLAVGVLWVALLPAFGHGTPAEKGGYVMADAGARDLTAWRLARSDRPLWSAFQGNRKVDQYGGLLFLSGLVYRYLGGRTHQPLLIIVITATVSSLALLFTWAMARRAWSARVGWLAAWVLCLFPEAILLGSSQMREAFMITLTSAAFYGLVRYQQDRSRAGLAWILAPLLLFLPFSPPFAALLLGLLALTALLTMAPFGRLINRRRDAPGAGHSRIRLWIIFGLLGVLVLAGLYLALKQFTPDHIWNPLEMLSWWLRKSAQFQAYLSQHASGWMQKLFKNTPEWLHLPMLMIYGIVQPFLPAALVAGSQAIIWQWIAVWRALGWTIMLAFLVYAPLLALRSGSNRPYNRRFTLALFLVVWLVILIAAYRGGSDQWDNPRYRATFAGLQAALAAWAWEEHRNYAGGRGDPWLRRAFYSALAVLAWFLPWYLRRYYSLPWPISDPFQTLGLGLASAALICLADWARTYQPPDRGRQ